MAWPQIYKLVVEEGKRPDEYAAWPKQVPPEIRQLIRQCWAQVPSMSMLSSCAYRHLGMAVSL